MGIRDRRYIVQTISTADYLMFGLLTLIVVMIGLLMPRLNNLLVGLVADSESRKMLASITAFMVCVSASSLMFGAAKSLMMTRMGCVLVFHFSSRRIYSIGSRSA